jgi:hypothetical protein
MVLQKLSQASLQVMTYSTGYVPEAEMMTSAPEKIPAVPMPATALPTMRAVLDGAIAHTKEPSSNMKIATRKLYLTWTPIHHQLDPQVDHFGTLTLKILYIRPYVGCSAVLVKK